MADTTVTNLNEGKSNLITRTSNAITDIRRILNEPAAKRALLLSYLQASDNYHFYY